MKSKFYRAFNGVYHRVFKLKNELVTVQIMNSFCKSYLLYANECLGLTVTPIRSLRNCVFSVNKDYQFVAVCVFLILLVTVNC